MRLVIFGLLVCLSGSGLVGWKLWQALEPSSTRAALNDSGSILAKTSEAGQGQQISVLGNSSNFDALVTKSKQPVLVEFGAKWCPGCRAMDPLLDDFAKQGKIEVVKIDYDKNADLVRKYGVGGIPCLFVFRDGNIVAITTRAGSIQAISDFVDTGIKSTTHYEVRGMGSYLLR